MADDVSSVQQIRSNLKIISAPVESPRPKRWRVRDYLFWGVIGFLGLSTLGSIARMVDPEGMFTGKRSPERPQAAVMQPVQSSPEKYWIVIVEIDRLQTALERQFKTEADCRHYMNYVVLPELDLWSMDYAKCEWRTS